jgi:hypothetical protein
MWNLPRKHNNGLMFETIVTKDSLYLLKTRTANGDCRIVLSGFRGLLGLEVPGAIAASMQGKEPWLVDLRSFSRPPWFDDHFRIRYGDELGWKSLVEQVDHHDTWPLILWLNGLVYPALDADVAVAPSAHRQNRCGEEQELQMSVKHVMLPVASRPHGIEAKRGAVTDFPLLSSRTISRVRFSPAMQYSNVIHHD